VDLTVWFFITSGLFLGWSLGANHAVNVFGTAVVSKMVRFRVAAVIGGIFVILGAVFSGAGTTRTLTDLGSINALAGSFAVALAVGIAVTAMTKAQLPVSTSQAVIGAIIGWNLFTGSPTDQNSLSKVLFSWVASPLTAALFGFLLFKIVKRLLQKQKIHLLELDGYTRFGLIVVGALASYSLGANNIGNVMGMFASAPLFSDLEVGGLFTMTGAQQLFLLGGVAIAVGIYTYGEKVMVTVGNDLYKISPLTGLVVVFAEFLVLTLFTSEALENLLVSLSLPSFPLVPLSTTQAFIGAVIGVGLAKDPHSINFRVLGKIAIGWVVAPVSAGIITFFSLFFIQNVFEQKVIHLVPYEVTESVIARLRESGVPTSGIGDLVGRQFDNKRVFKNELMSRAPFSNEQIFDIFQYSLIDSIRVDTSLVVSQLSDGQLSQEQYQSIRLNHGATFRHKIDFAQSVFNNQAGWLATGDKITDRQLSQKKLELMKLFTVEQPAK
jgi:PiT family inorganic phosphate transporter